MSLKDLFIQKDEVPEIPTSLRDMARKHSASVEPVSEPLADFDTTGLDLTNIVPISEIYAKEGIADLTRSIFKVEETKNVLPAALATDAKKQSVLGMLQVLGLDVAALMTDANLRIDTLKSAQATFNEKAADSIATDEGKIADLEAQIDALKQNINTTKKNSEAQNTAIDAEVNRINDVLKFIG